jgi:uncharacterized protein (TIGR02145 family)
MKKSAVITIFLVSAMLNTQAQDYLIRFAGSGDTNVVSTVKVDNLTSGAAVTLNGSDILHLSASVGIGSVDTDHGALQVYPNPMDEESALTFVSPENGNAVISIVDLSGKTVYQISTLLSSGRQSFRISGISRGMYFVNVTGNNYSYSAKLISQNYLQSDAGIEHVFSAKNIQDNRLKGTAATIDMQYNDGDQLLYKGISGKYSTVVPDVPTGSKTITFKFAACTDADNNNYSIVQTGTQKWMAENLNVGVRIAGGWGQTNNSTIEKYCYNNTEANCAIYGGLYQWKEMMQYVTTPGIQGICPTGWHIPTYFEWTTLINFLGGEGVAGGKMKSTGTIEAGTGLWHAPNTGATNESGFTAVPAGGRNVNGMFDLIGNYGLWWSSSEYGTSSAWYCYLYYDYSVVYTLSYSKNYGFSVRCLQDF